MPKNRSKTGSWSHWTGLATVIMINLKVTGLIDWHWWWVLFPLWGVYAVDWICDCALDTLGRNNESDTSERRSAQRKGHAR